MSARRKSREAKSGILQNTDNQSGTGEGQPGNLPASQQVDIQLEHPSADSALEEMNSEVIFTVDTVNHMEIEEENNGQSWEERVEAEETETNTSLPCAQNSCPKNQLEDDEGSASKRLRTEPESPFGLSDIVGGFSPMSAFGDPDATGSPVNDYVAFDQVTAFENVIHMRGSEDGGDM